MPRGGDFAEVAGPGLTYRQVPRPLGPLRGACVKKNPRKGDLAPARLMILAPEPLFGDFPYLWGLFPPYYVILRIQTPQG